MELPVTLRDLARRVDVRRPILPPPGLAPALLAAADELERQAARMGRQKAEIEAIGARIAEQANAIEVSGDLLRLSGERLAAMQADAQALLAGMETAGPALRELLPLLRPWINAATAARKALDT